MNKYYFTLAVVFFYAQILSAQTIINDYTPVTGYDPTCNSLIVTNATSFSTGDEVLVIQMKGAEIDTSNTSAFGTLKSLNNCGNYEINKVRVIAGNAVGLDYNLTNNYDYAAGKVQLVRVPRHSNYTVNSTHSCAPWNGSSGGVFAIIVSNTLTLNNNIDVSEKGFRGGANANNIFHTQYTRNQQDYCYPVNNFSGAMKGEGITEVSTNKQYCRGELYNGGGGANSTNSGGGGGGNGGAGGQGGDEWVGAPATAVGGRGGQAFAYNPSVNKITMGGGGGAGDVNDRHTSDGGNGGGIVLIFAGTIVGNNKILAANGEQGLDCSPSSSFQCNDGFGGGGAGGTILINAQTLSNINVHIAGGRGANLNTNSGAHAPGGGGAGGALLVNNASLFSNINFNFTGGVAGILTMGASTTNWGAKAGNQGDTTSNFIIPFASTPFNFSGLNASISDSVSACKTMTFRLTTSSSINSVDWDLGDGNTSNGATITHTYNTSGNYTIRAIIKTTGGCSDTLQKNIQVPDNNINETIIDSIIGCKEIILSSQNNGSKIKQYEWSLGDGNTDSTNPVSHRYNQPGTYNIQLIVTDSIGCADTINHSISFTNVLDYNITDSVIDCTKAAFDTVYVSGPKAASILWVFDDGNTSTSAPIQHRYQKTGTYLVKLIVRDTAGCTDTSSKLLALQQYPITIEASNDTQVCFKNETTLTAAGAATYTWTPQNALDNNKGASVIARPTETITYTVVGVDTAGCRGTDTVRVEVLPLPDIKISATRDYVTCDSPEVFLFASGGKDYEWFPEEYFPNKNSINPSVAPDLNTKFSVKGYDDYGCWNIVSLIIKAERMSKIFMPTAFTPNRDGLNDAIKPIVVCNFNFERMMLYNRWGELVYSTNDISNGWDGTYNGKTQDLGTYQYMITGKNDTGSDIMFKGNFVLVR